MSAHATALHDLTTGFISRLRAQDHDAWFELWEIFGPVLRAQLSRWGRGRIGHETVQDLTQETMAALAGAIDRHDPTRGARFSTWLLAIARYTLSDEMDRRMAQKRGSGNRGVGLEDVVLPGGSEASPDQAYEQQVFDAKVEAALRAVEKEAGFMDFEVFRLRVLEGKSGLEVADSLGVSAPTISRRLTRSRSLLRSHLEVFVTRYSFTAEEIAEMERNGLTLSPNKKDEAAFDEAIADVYHRISQRRAGSDGATERE